MLKLISLVALISLPAFGMSTRNCSAVKINVITTAHTDAMAKLKTANIKLKNLNDPLVVDAFLDYFKIDVYNPDHLELVSRVLYMMKRFETNGDNTVYKCGNHFGWCYTEPLAIVPPPKRRIHLCSPYFNRNYDKQVATIIHEWGHRWGGFKIAYAFEKYCYDWDDLGPEKIVRQPDAYMLFTYYLATNGVGIGCFKK